MEPSRRNKCFDTAYCISKGKLVIHTFYSTNKVEYLFFRGHCASCWKFRIKRLSCCPWGAHLSGTGVSKTDNIRLRTRVLGLRLRKGPCALEIPTWETSHEGAEGASRGTALNLGGTVGVCQAERPSKASRAVEAVCKGRETFPSTLGSENLKAFTRDFQ